METPQIIQYINLCKCGHTDAFRPIVSEYQQLVYTLAFRILGNENDAEDMTQETFIKCWQNIHLYKQQYKFSTWIYKIACNLCYDRLRSQHHIKNVNLTNCDTLWDVNHDEWLHHKELKNLIVQLSNGLSPKQKLIFTLSELEDLSADEIRTITGLSSSKIKSNLYLAKKYIKSKMINYE